MRATLWICSVKVLQKGRTVYLKLCDKIGGVICMKFKISFTISDRGHMISENCIASFYPIMLN